MILSGWCDGAVGSFTGLLSAVSHVLSMVMWVSFGFIGFLSLSVNMQIVGLAVLRLFVGVNEHGNVGVSA